MEQKEYFECKLVHKMREHIKSKMRTDLGHLENKYFEIKFNSVSAAETHWRTIKSIFALENEFRRLM